MTIREAYVRFPDRIACIRHIERIRWGDHPVCPYCNRVGASPLDSEGRRHCKRCHTTYSATVGTVMHNSKLDPRKWVCAVAHVITDEPLSVRKLASFIKVNKNTASMMIMRITDASPSQRALLLSIGDVK